MKLFTSDGNEGRREAKTVRYRAYKELGIGFHGIYGGLMGSNEMFMGFSGKRLHNYGKSPCYWMGKSTINGYFHSCVKLAEGIGRIPMSFVYNRWEIYIIDIR